MRGTVRVLGVLLTMGLATTASAQGLPIGSEFQINTYTSNGQYSPRVAKDAAGNFVVVWYSSHQEGDNNGVFGQRFSSSGARLGTEFQVNTYTTNNQSYPAVASDAAGDFVVVWQSDQDGSGRGIFGQRFDSAGAPLGTEFQVNTYTTSGQDYPMVASDAAGNFLVVWQSFQDGDGEGVFGQRYDSTGNTVGTEFQVNAYTSGNQGFPVVAIGPTGSFVVIWADSEQDSGLGVFGRRFSSTGTPLGTDFQVNTYTTGNRQYPTLASDAAGNFVVAWQSYGQDGDSDGVFGQRFSSNGAAVGTEFQVNSYTTGRQKYPGVAADADGNFVVVWESRNQDGDDYGVFGQRFSNTGSRLGTEFQVNTYTTSFQGGFPIGVADAAGGFVVVWASDTEDGSREGIFGQRFSAAPAPRPVPALGPLSLTVLMLGLLVLGAGALLRRRATRNVDRA